MSSYPYVSGISVTDIPVGSVTVNGEPGSASRTVSMGIAIVAIIGVIQQSVPVTVTSSLADQGYLFGAIVSQGY